MNFVPEFAPDAQSQWRDLEPTLQELVLDKMEELVKNPPPQHMSELYADVVYDDQKAWHYIFLSVNIDHRKGKITLTGVNRFSRPKSR